MSKEFLDYRDVFNNFNHFPKLDQEQKLTRENKELIQETDDLASELVNIIQESIERAEQGEIYIDLRSYKSVHFGKIQFLSTDPESFKNFVQKGVYNTVDNILINIHKSGSYIYHTRVEGENSEITKSENSPKILKNHVNFTSININLEGVGELSGIIKFIPGNGHQLREFAVNLSIKDVSNCHLDIKDSKIQYLDVRGAVFTGGKLYHDEVRLLDDQNSIVELSADGSLKTKAIDVRFGDHTADEEQQTFATDEYSRNPVVKELNIIKGRLSAASDPETKAYISSQGITKFLQSKEVKHINDLLSSHDNVGLTLVSQAGKGVESIGELVSEADHLAML